MGRYIVFAVFLGLIFMPYTALAMVSGPCYKCHAMHFSQSPWPTGWQSEGPNDYLLVKKGGGGHCSPCVSCHSSETSSTYEDLGGGLKVPIVFYFGASAPTEYLAGGNFWWVKEGLGDNDTKGHNVFEDEDDEDLSAGAPGDSGFAGCGTNPCHLNLSRPADIAGMPELDGKYGCEGCHLNVRHHANDHPNGESGLVNSADQGWYRFLSGHMSGSGQGVEGYEDGHWEAGQPDLARGQANNHNEYLGNENTGGYGFNLGHTTTAFCTGCHGAFHQLQYSSGSWVRHPSDAVIPDTAGSEYADTGGASHEYDPLSPVASPTVDGTPDGTVTPGTDFVMCLSCHRPHGSPYPDMLRWDYSQQIAGSDPGEGILDQGCFYCHTKKDN